MPCSEDMLTWGENWGWLPDPTKATARMHGTERCLGGHGISPAHGKQEGGYILPGDEGIRERTSAAEDKAGGNSQKLKNVVMRRNRHGPAQKGKKPLANPKRRGHGMRRRHRISPCAGETVCEQGKWDAPAIDTGIKGDHRKPA